MRRTINIYIEKYDWLLRLYIGFDKSQTMEVVDLLRSIGCIRNEVRRAYRTLHSGRLNNGMTFAAFRSRTAVMVIGRTSSPAEFLDSLVHEVMHLAHYISTYEGIQLTSEETCYMGGDIARSIYPYCKELLCCGCTHG